MTVKLRLFSSDRLTRNTRLGEVTTTRDILAVLDELRTAKLARMILLIGMLITLAYVGSMLAVVTASGTAAGDWAIVGPIVGIAEAWVRQISHRGSLRAGAVAG